MASVLKTGSDLNDLIVPALDVFEKLAKEFGEPEGVALEWHDLAKFTDWRNQGGRNNHEDCHRAWTAKPVSDGPSYISNVGRLGFNLIEATINLHRRMKADPSLKVYDKLITMI